MMVLNFAYPMCTFSPTVSVCFAFLFDNAVEMNCFAENEQK